MKTNEPISINQDVMLSEDHFTYIDEDHDLHLVDAETGESFVLSRSEALLLASFTFDFFYKFH